VILKGVEIDRGSIIVANAVVTRSVSPYSVVAGVLAKVIKWRWKIADIIKHEECLYPVKKKISISDLESYRKQYFV